MENTYRMQGDGCEPMDRAECQECRGTGTVTRIVGDDEMGFRCESCGGLGRELTRDDWANLIALQDDLDAQDARDLRLVPEAEEAA